MIDKLVSAARYFTNRDVPGPGLSVNSDDTFLVSYPKSGNTWIRFLVANFVYPEAGVTLLSADRLVPNVDGQSKKYFKQMPRPRIIKSHYPFQHAYKRVIYVVRDPRDVVLSQYHYQIKRGVLPVGAPIEPFVSRFLAGDVCPYGSWGENVSSWLAARGKNPDFVLIRYEDLLRQTSVELARMAKLLKIEPTPDRIALAVERSTADRMRQLEKAEGSQWASTKGTRQDMSFIRAAKDRQWKTGLPQECVAQIENEWGEWMGSLGYTEDVGQDAGLPAPESVPALI
ncbi:MAG: sulfotransferase domain-containing protein [Candidatus Sulfotelmatobacter sp.]